MRQPDVAAATRALLGAEPDAPLRPQSDDGAAQALTHLGGRGEARMVDVSGKAVTRAHRRRRRPRGDGARDARLVLTGNAKKGDVLGAARIAGIMAAKRTHELIPLCHPLALSKVDGRYRARRDSSGLRVRATVKVAGQTGVEMEALTAVVVACLTIYDMVKAVERGMRIEGIRLVEKTRRQVRPLSRRRSEHAWR